MSASPSTNGTTPVAEVYRLRDGWAALQLALLARRHHVADYVESNASDLVETSSTVSLASSSTSSSSPSSSSPVLSPPSSWVCVGESAQSRREVYLVLPSYAALFFDYTMRSALFTNAEMSRQYAGRCLIAKLQTIGGGWASLHRADRSLLCALQLYRVAAAVFDEEVVRKCRLFIGWAHLWNSHPAKALEVFQEELADAQARGDTVHERRCLHAICNTTQNPLLAPGGAYTNHYDLVDCWSRAFA